MLNHRLLLATGDAAHADAVERALYNVVATSPAQDGHAFFYTNTLHQRVPGTVPETEVASPRAASSLRAPWFEVSCCPTNVARTVASLGSYLASVDDDGVQLHQYAPATVRAALPGGGDVVLDVATRYPEEGRVVVTVRQGPDRPWTLSLRVPAWADGAVLDGGDGDGARAASPGYATVTRTFTAGDVVTLDLPVTARWTRPDPRVDAVRGQVAVERGPVVLALESTDLGASVNHVQVRTDEPPVERDGTVLVRATTLELDDPAWPYVPDVHGVVRGETDRGLVPLVPYASWGNRGPSTMRVWMPVAG
jgi:hypothetical protein